MKTNEKAQDGFLGKQKLPKPIAEEWKYLSAPVTIGNNVDKFDKKRAHSCGLELILPTFKEQTTSMLDSGIY